MRTVQKLPAVVAALTMLAGCAPKPIAVTQLTADSGSDDLDQYERLTDEEKSAITPVSYDEAMKLFDGGTGMVIYSADWCPYCQRALPVLADAALDADTPVHYVSFSDGTITEDQIDALGRHFDWIEFAVAEDDQKEHAKSFPLPQVVAIKDGKAVAHHTSLFDGLSITDTNFELSDSQKAELRNIYADMFEALRSGKSVSSDRAKATEEGNAESQISKADSGSADDCDGGNAGAC